MQEWKDPRLGRQVPLERLTDNCGDKVKNQEIESANASRRQHREHTPKIGKTGTKASHASINQDMLYSLGIQALKPRGVTSGSWGAGAILLAQRTGGRNVLSKAGLESALGYRGTSTVG